MDESHHCNVLQLLLKSEGWMNFTNDTSHVPGCQVTIFNSRFISQKTFSHSAIWFLSQRTGQEVGKGQVGHTSCTAPNTSFLPFFQLMKLSSQQWEQFPRWAEKAWNSHWHLLFNRIFFFYCLSRSTPWCVRQGAGWSLKKFGNSKVIAIFLTILVFLMGSVILIKASLKCFLWKFFDFEREISQFCQYYMEGPSK